MTAPWVNAPGQWEEGALRWNFYDLNMMGDVAVSPWHDEPFTPNVNYPTEILEGMTSMEVKVTNENGEGLKNFRCALFDGEELLGVAYTDESGLAIIEFSEPVELADGMNLIVTGCDAWPQNIIFDLTATAENAMVDVNIYPNPNKGQFTINLPETACDIVVVNSLGQTVHHTAASGMTTLNVENLSEGVYFVTVKSESGVKTMKFIKE